MYEFKKIFIFDLDDTLFLHNVQESFRNEYHIKITKFLNHLKANDKLICLVTYNINPKRLLNDLIHLFDYVYTPNVMSFHEYQYQYFEDYTKFKDYTPWVCNGKVSLCKNKSIVIKEILSKFNCDYYKAIFFDDNPNHIKSVQQLGIEAIQVNPLNGIPLAWTI